MPSRRGVPGAAGLQEFEQPFGPSPHVDFFKQFLFFDDLERNRVADNIDQNSQRHGRVQSIREELGGSRRVLREPIAKSRQQMVAQRGKVGVGRVGFDLFNQLDPRDAKGACRLLFSNQFVRARDRAKRRLYRPSSSTSSARIWPRQAMG